MIDPAIFIGEPIRYNNKCWIYPPKVKDVVSNPTFNQYLRILTISEDDIKETLLSNNEDNISQTPFEFLLINSYHNETFRQRAQEAFEFYLHQKVTFAYDKKTILLGDLSEITKTAKSMDDLVFITESEYFDFQNAIRAASGKAIELPPYVPPIGEDPRVTRIKEKARLRDRIKARKGTANSIQISACLVAICCMGIGITPLNIGEMSYASLNPIMNMYQGQEKYHIDIDSLLAGADSKKIKPKYWIRNLTD